MVYQGDLYLGGQRQGSITDRGPFDQYAAYRPGDVVLDGGAPYLCTAPVGGPLIARDTFQRAAASRWGVSSDGQEWAPYVQGSDTYTVAIGNQRGIVPPTATADDYLTMLLDSLDASTNRDVLVRGAFDRDDSAGDAMLGVVLASDSDLANFTQVRMSRTDDGHLDVRSVTRTGGSTATGFDSTDLADPGVATDVWVRVRQQASTLRVRVWPAGVAEPTDWDGTHAAVSGAWGRRVGLALNVTATSQVSVAYFSARALTAADAPSDDTDHWQPLATAFALPLPV